MHVLSRRNPLDLVKRLASAVGEGSIAVASNAGYRLARMTPMIINTTPMARPVVSRWTTAPKAPM